jgi:hypothetical protein
MTAALMAQNKVMHEQAEKAEKLKRDTQATATAWQDMGRHTTIFARNIASVTTSLLKWSTLTAVFGGLLGVGGIFGLDRLAASAGGARQTAAGLRLSIGQQKAFGIAYGNIANVGDLQRAQDWQTDLSKRGALAAMGIYDPESMDTVSFYTTMMQRAAKMYRPGMSKQEREAAGFGQFFDVNQLNQFKAENFAEDFKRYSSERTRLNIPDETAQRWQEFLKNLKDAGETIEKVLVNSLGVLTPQISALSKGVVDLATALGESPRVKEWLSDLADVLHSLADWLRGGGIPGFHPVGASVGGVIGLAVGGLPGAAAGAIIGSDIGGIRTVKGARNYDFSWKSWDKLIGGERNNPGNIMIPGTHTLAKFSSVEEGLRRMAKLLLGYEHNLHLDTIAKIVSRYAPPSENDTAAYIRDVAKRTGFGPGQHLDLNNPGVLSALISAMTKHEDAKSNYTPAQVRIAIENNTGGNTVVNVRQACPTAGP